MLQTSHGERTPREGAGQLPVLLLDQGQLPYQLPVFMRSARRLTCASRFSRYSASPATVSLHSFGRSMSFGSLTLVSPMAHAICSGWRSWAASMLAAGMEYLFLPNSFATPLRRRA